MKPIDSGRSIRGWRVRLGMSLRETAKQAGITAVRLGEIERGKVKPTPYERNQLNLVFIAASSVKDG